MKKKREGETEIVVGEGMVLSPCGECLRMYANGEKYENEPRNLSEMKREMVI